VSYKDMLTPGHAQFHPTMLTIMGQINQALTGYGCKCRQIGNTDPSMRLMRTLTRSFCLRTSNLRAVRLQHDESRIPHARQLCLLFRLDDLCLDPG
jgi:hypothetical protein